MTQMGGSHLENVAEDILCLILMLCDIYTVLSVSQVNKSLRRIAYSKQIWICLIADLSARGLIDLPHDRALQTYSVVEMFEEVKRVVLGPQTWSRPELTPIISREIKVSNSSADDTRSHELLPGGIYLLVEQSFHLELWHVPTSAVIWSLNCPLVSRSKYSIELVDHQRSAIFQYFNLPRLMRFIHIDLDTGYSKKVFELVSPQETSFASWPKISGDFFHCGLWGPTEGNYFMAGNWRTGTTAMFKCESPTEVNPWIPLQTNLVAGHIFSARHLPPQSLWIHTFSLKDFFSRWQPTRLTSIDDAISIYDMPPTISQLLPFKYPRRAHMGLYESPLRHDTYKLMLYVIGHQPSRYSLKGMRQTLSTLLKNTTIMERAQKAPCTLYSFHLSISDNTIVNSALSSSAGSPYLYSHGIMSYAGYVETRIGVTSLHLCDPYTRKVRDQKLGPIEAPKIGHLSQYSHAVTSCKNSSYIISYYV
ncbi:hypothetical protein C8J57DRAFT_1707083 [Mycena rebaudengoi]|nr:hypothetical protein C8J57DRAFT_1707083 [Mycena rebaudengoi]